MRVIICGAGQVGINIARYLSQFDTDITIIDLNEGLVRDALDTLDVQGIVGHASILTYCAKQGRMMLI